MFEEKAKSKPTIVLNSQVSWGLRVACWINEHGASFVINKRVKNKETGEYSDSKYLNLLDLAALGTHIPDLIERAQTLLDENTKAYRKGELPVIHDPLPGPKTDDDIPF